MWSSRLFWKLFLVYAGLNIASAIVFVLIVSGRQKTQVEDQVQQRLHDSAVIMRSSMEGVFDRGFSEQLQIKVEKLGAETGTRITLIDMDGVVIADSDQSSLQLVRDMENHKNRVEVIKALATGSGTSERRSPTLSEPMKYYALLYRHDGEPKGVVRVSITMSKIQLEIASIEKLIWSIALLVSFTVMLITYWVVARMIRPLTILTNAAESIANGDYDQKLYFPQHDELGILAQSFNHMSKEMAERVRQLQASGDRLSTVLEGMVEGVIATNERQHVLFANESAGRLLFFSPEEAQGKPLFESVRNHQLQKAVTEVLKTLEPQRMEVELESTSDRILGVTTTPLPGTPCPGLVIVLFDMTELRRLESLRQEFVANVSHELKTPLSSIKAYTETLIRGAMDDPEISKTFLMRIEEQADRLHQLILDLISLASIESGNQVFDIISIELRPFVESCLVDQQTVAESKQIELIIEEQEPGLRVKADEEGLHQILGNLINNAIKYTPEQGTITIRWQRDEGNMVLLQVQDTGIGIEEKHLARLFERFFRVDKARSRELGGTGLGLSIVKHLVQSFNGTIGVTSKVGTGTTFSVRLPRG
ncbi:two-component system histidine kinase PnpS [Gimesia chilikensis]|jgi:two-component system phosphate regulon sensor histidine kinase PhoR|uniref:histidine kinase n=1 Tax=Gimesia chilikensis TaxID=2605989 RepID=A0A517PHB8_9PLAN|nr:ATP-binding protein [Gimesia chilikensis]KAA0138318.1 cell wall metabolism sensor histidine kinase WalK [Gimesia chilikensis]MBN67706.1 PAS domain-containing sensor histidine kinase [Gimesia sp.]QDT18766.1 Alkaline phosphatase synthesis sensor protein PhoR [Gimesia chilikensis]QDT82887.1 Alkaline phosphatase synthesis sensor protein PhoR [Gimesia chilikensis]